MTKRARLPYAFCPCRLCRLHRAWDRTAFGRQGQLALTPRRRGR